MMVKARIGNTVLFGLSRENIDRLTKGKPIRIQGHDIGLPGQNFIIHFGETEEAIAVELDSLFHEKH